MWTVIGSDFIPREYRSILRMGCWCRFFPLIPIDSIVTEDGASVRMFCPECHAHYKALSANPNPKELEILQMLPKRTAIAAGSFPMIQEIAKRLDLDPEMADAYAFSFFKAHGHASMVGLAKFIVECVERDCEFLIRPALEADLVSPAGTNLMSQQYLKEWRSRESPIGL